MSNSLASAGNRGSFLLRLLQRVGGRIFGFRRPQKQSFTRDIIARLYPSEDWKSLSGSAQVSWLKLHRLFETNNIQTILWVGANDGKDVQSIDEAFPGREFYLLEPVHGAFERLRSAMASRTNVQIFQVAAGDGDRESEIFVDEFDQASSLLPYEDGITGRYATLGRQSKEVIQVRAVDGLIQEWQCQTIDLLVVDVQGYENFVLAGAAKTLASCKAVIVEMSLQTLYRGSSTFESVYERLRSYGFQLRHITHVHRDDNNEIVQIDGVFVRKSSDEASGNSEDLQNRSLHA